MKIGISKLARKTKNSWGVWWLQRVYYQKRTGKKLHYYSPKDINEKSIWLTRFWQNPLKSICADKYLVREYLRRRGLGHLSVPILGAYNNADEIDFNQLPKQFVLKCNHGCNMNIICLDKDTLDIDATKKQLSEWLTQDWGKVVYEIYYSNIPRKIICEELLSETAPIEYQIWCVNGIAESILVCRKNFDGTYDSWSYSLDWNRLFDRISETEDPAPKPKDLSQIIKYAEILAEPFPFLRADFYEVDGKIYVAEMTITPGGHILNSYKEDFINRLGEKLQLPKQTWTHPNIPDIKNDYVYMKRFVNMMQLKATQIGMASATFDDPSGISFLNVGTVTDLAKLTREALSSHLLEGKWNTPARNIIYLNRGVCPRRRKLISTIDYVDLNDSRYKILGAKTGSGGGVYNIMMGVECRGEKYVIIVGNAHSIEQRTETIKMLLARVLSGSLKEGNDLSAITTDCALYLGKIYENGVEKLYTHNEQLTFPLLSTTKILTLLVAEEYKKILPYVIRIKDFDTMWEAPDWLKRKSLVSTVDLIYAMLLPSSNVATLAVSRTIGKYL